MHQARTDLSHGGEMLKPGMSLGGDLLAFTEHVC